MKFRLYQNQTNFLDTHKCIPKPSHVSGHHNLRLRREVFHNYVFRHIFSGFRQYLVCIDGFVKIAFRFEMCWIAGLRQYEPDEFMAVITRNVKGWPFIAFYCEHVNCEIPHFATALNIKSWSTLLLLLLMAYAIYITHPILQCFKCGTVGV